MKYITISALFLIGSCVVVQAQALGATTPLDQQISMYRQLLDEANSRLVAASAQMQVLMKERIDDAQRKCEPPKAPEPPKSPETQ